MQGPVEFLFAHSCIFLNPFNFTQMADIVARHSATHVARQCHEQAGDRVHVQRSHAGDDQCLATERDDATSQERPQKQSEVAPLGKELDERIEHLFRL